MEQGGTYMKQYDVAIVGGGPGGYVAAIRAAKAGLSVAIIEGDELGGTCLNRGCIPSKTLLKHAEVMDQIKHADELAIHVDSYSIDLKQMVERKNKVINQLNSGIKALLRQNKVKAYQGFGYVHDDKKITIKSAEKEYVIEATSIILANGSEVAMPQIPGIEDINVYTSDTIFDVKDIPEYLVIVGGGVIGMEIACIYNSFGSKVEIIELADRILPLEDKEASAFLQKQLEKKDVVFRTESKVTHFENVDGKSFVHMEEDGKKTFIPADAVLMCVGRKPNKTGLDDLSVTFDGPFVKTDNNLQTSISGIYAIGDLIGGYQLAHAASEEGIKAVEHITNENVKNSTLMPRCVYTFPEIASVGLTEKEAKEQGYRVKIKKIDLAANGKAIAANENSGFMKIIADEKYNEILGVVMTGSHVTEMISQATAFMHLEGTVDEIASMVFPHPTISEGMFEAANAYLQKGIHYF